MADLDPERRQPPCSPAPTAPRPRDLARPKASPPAVAAFPDADLVLHDFSDVDSYYAPAHSLSYGELEYHDKIQVRPGSMFLCSWITWLKFWCPTIKFDYG